ncbi:MAG: response regulator transcription factor [Chloroflexi bacterium]|nr:response regulator transcription factor [Chloroflexota bacterium]
MGDMRVLLVDDHPVVREGLRRVLNLGKGIQVVGEASDGEEALALAEKLSPDVVLMDIKMPNMDGIEATRWLRDKLPSTNVVMLTSYEDEYVGQAIAAGAVGYLLKDVAPNELIDAIHGVCEGRWPLDASLVQVMFAQYAALSKGKQSRESELSERQQEIIRLVASGMTYTAISERLFLSPPTIKREMRRIFDKFEASDRASVVAEAYKRKVI